MKTFLIASLAYIINGIGWGVAASIIGEDGQHLEWLFYGVVSSAVFTFVGISAGLLMSKSYKPTA